MNMSSRPSINSPKTEAEITGKDASKGKRGERRLIHVPVIHSREDMGSLGESLPSSVGFSATATDFWQHVQQAIKNLKLDWRRVKVYQDGLPNTTVGGVTRIIAEVSSPNYELLRWMIAQRATALGTESPRLLNEEYTLLKSIISSQDLTAKKQAAATYARRAPSLLEQRDTYIAKRIDQTLRSGETGILFVGVAHSVVEKLPQSIHVCQMFTDLSILWRS